MRKHRSDAFVDRWIWACALLAILLSAAILLVFGITWWSALLAALLLACPVLLAWGAIQGALDKWRERSRTS